MMLEQMMIKIIIGKYLSLMKNWMNNIIRDRNHVVELQIYWNKITKII